ncbi:MAG: diguanylate cyclase [Lachnospiraceae bacterium]|nr:diguanylate cyclase [Lachnospiraceae bacterium]
MGLENTEKIESTNEEKTVQTAQEQSPETSEQATSAAPPKKSKPKKQAKPKHKKKLWLQICNITLVPILLMGILFICIGLYSLRMSSVEETFLRLRGVAVLTAEHFSAINGLYHMDSGDLYCGDRKMSDELPFLEEEKRAFNTDLSIFYGNNRVMTTMIDENGKRRLGTVLADNRIVTEVFKGNIVSTEKNMIGNERYLCVYVPIYNNNQVVGMVGSAISLSNFYRMNRIFYIEIALLTLITAMITFLLISVFTNKIVKRLIVIREYMEEIVKKQTAEQEMDPLAFNRNDEIAELATHSVNAATSIKNLMGTDPLTGLYNRRAGRQRLIKLWEDSLENFEVFTIVIGDLDHFKNINDKYGHDMGDTVLTNISAILKKHCTGRDFAVRWGGEEFLMGFCSAREESYEIVKNISKDIKREAFFAGEGVVFHMSMTFGMASFAGEEKIDDLITIADRNLYKGKNSGRDCIVS